MIANKLLTSPDLIRQQVPSALETNPADRYRLRHFLLISGILSTLLVVYASLVPLNLTPLSWQETLHRWSSIPWLDLTVRQRADWIANTLIFIPPVFLTSGYFLSAPENNRRRMASAWFLIVISFSLLVLLIELLQVWFPPRTVSWNDVAAGLFGVILGCFAWQAFGQPLGFWLSDMLTQQSTAGKATSAIALAMLGCLGYSLYPFDFVVSLAELEEKQAIGRLRWWVDTAASSWLDIGRSWGVAAVRLLPFGIWLGWKVRPGLAWFGILSLAVLFELVQVPIFSKHAAGDEVIAGIFGGILGWLLTYNLAWWKPLLDRSWIWGCMATIWSVMIPLAFLSRCTSWVSDPQQIHERWWSMLSPPLLRYYYTSEYSALSNLAGKLAMFSMLGFLVAGFSLARDGRSSRWPLVSGLAITISLGLLIEISQVYLYPLIADISDIIIYLLGFGLGILFGKWLLNRGIRQGSRISL
jgi:VanZ family protein